MANIGNEDLKWLLELLESENLAEIEVSVGSDTIVLKSPSAQAPIASAALGAALARPSAAAAATPAEPEVGERLLSPMSGIFYRAASPDTPAFAEPGDSVKVGDTIGLIEAMKLYNEVTSHLNGRIVKFLVENEQHIEADQPLVLIERFHQ
ncbi:MAG: acetyl-CoA carboxylase biotin carboxyl carrier protein [Bacteroidota bacterium]